jgi:hypothetical protein
MNHIRKTRRNEGTGRDVGLRVAIIKYVFCLAFLVSSLSPSSSFASVLTSNEISLTKLFVFVAYLRAPKPNTRSKVSVFRQPQEFIKFSVQLRHFMKLCS